MSILFAHDGGSEGFGNILIAFQVIYFPTFHIYNCPGIKHHDKGLHFQMFIRHCLEIKTQNNNQTIKSPIKTYFFQMDLRKGQLNSIRAGNISKLLALLQAGIDGKELHIQIYQNENKNLWIFFRHFKISNKIIQHPWF